MKVTIDGITYEGTVDEIRDIVSNPPTSSTKHISIDIPPVDFPKDDGNNTNRHKRDDGFHEWEKETTPFAPTPPYAPTYPSIPPRSWPDDFPRQWDGTPIVTCSNSSDQDGGVCGTSTVETRSSRTSSDRGCSTMY